MLRIFLVIDDYNELIYLQSLLKKIGFDVEGLQNQKKYADVSLGFNPQVLITTAKGQKVDGIALARSITKRRGIPKILALRTPGASYSPNQYHEAGVDEILDSPINPRKLMLAIANLGGIDENTLLEKYNKMKSNVVTEEDVQQILVHDDLGQPTEDIQRVKAALENAAKQHEENPSLFTVRDENSTSGDGANGAAARFPLDTSPAAILESAPVLDVTGFGADLDVGLSPSPQPLEDDALGSAKTDLRKQRNEKWLKDIGKLPKSHFNRDRITDFNKKIRARGSSEDIDQIESDRREFVRALFKNKK
jgi:DNA-binding response OmpR family regulator